MNHDDPITSAMNMAQMLAQVLREVGTQSGAVLNVAIRPLIADAAALHHKIMELRDAIKADAETEK